MRFGPPTPVESGIMLLGCGPTGAHGAQQITDLDFGATATLGSDFATGGEAYYALIAFGSGVICFWFFLTVETQPVVSADYYQAVPFDFSDAPGDMSVKFGNVAALYDFTNITPPSSGGLCRIRDDSTGPRAEPVIASGCPLAWSIFQLGY